VAAFLLEMNGRMKSTGAMALPMTRRNIGDYLGLTIEDGTTCAYGISAQGF
jgi:CRP/FNR family nitrogen fixation transcriptional regulator